MTQDPLTALQRHFEEQYGKLNAGVTRKKRKRGHVEMESPTEVAGVSDEEWQGIQSVENPQSNVKPQIISFTETTEVTEDEVTAYKSFMVLF